MGGKKFTLIELLMVVAVLSILMALMLPALKSAKETGIAIKCTSNLRQLGTYFNMYSHDNREWLPPNLKVVPWDTTGTKLGYWPDFINYTYFGKKTSQASWGNIMAKPFMRCPKNPEYPDVVSTAYMNYGMNSCLFNAPVSKMKTSPSTLYLLLDHGSFNASANIRTGSYVPGIGALPGVATFAAPTSTTPQYVDFYKGRHRGTVNMLYLDGHGKLTIFLKDILEETDKYRVSKTSAWWAF
ncbi:MAG: hypothetical protein A2X49_01205 [Lentisphaerae bacterium GWF2_52_8]|nr:MAG: hypothetical protein A2X49_01205 [Lentisphaerae bacterium GWF2_52_8]